MDKKTQNAFEAVVKGLGLSDSDICQWLIKRDTFLVPTELPIVYAEGKELTIKPGLDVKLKDKVWGIQLPSGVILAGNVLGLNADGKPYSGEDIMELAKSYTLNGKAGCVTPSWYLEKLKIRKTWVAHEKTTHVLNDYCDSCLPFDYGFIWTSTNHFETNCLCFDMQRVNNERDWGAGYINNWYTVKYRKEEARLALWF